MKTKVLALLVSCALTVVAHAGDAAEKPAILIDKVVALATESLAERKYTNIFIEKITLDTGSLFSKDRKWFVQWSQPVQGSKPGVSEIGLYVRMDGSVVHVVKQ